MDRQGNRLLVAALILLAACSSGGAPVAPATTCGDGLKNGSETGVDCGGSCGATCSLGVACSGSSDCLFGACQAGACVAPSTGPAPTGPVTALIPSEGATLTAVTAEHVSVSLVFPAGAVTAPLSVTLTPQPLTGKGWFSVAVEPAGMLLAAPASVQVALPAGTPASVASDGLLLFSGAADASLLPTAATGLTLGAPVRALGVPGFVGGPPSVPVTMLAAAGVTPTTLVAPGAPAFAPVIPASIPINLLMGLPLSWATRIALADNLITVLSATGRNRDALEISSLIVAILSRWGDPALSGQLNAFVDRAWTSACRGFNATRSALVANNTAGHPACPAEAIRFAQPMMNWVLLLEKMEGYSTAGCANYSGSAWIDDMGRAFNTTITVEKTDVVRMWRCDCTETPARDWTIEQRGHCLSLGFTGLKVAAQPTSAVVPVDVPTTDLEWDHLADTVARAYQEASLLDYEGLDAPATTERALLADPHLLLARSLAFAGCRRDGTQKPVARLLAVIPGLPALQDDGQYCATALGARQTNASGGLLAQLAASLGGVDAGQKRTAGSLQAAKAGTLSLSGPIAALYCPDGSTGNDEHLLVKLDGTTLQTLSPGPYLAAQLDLDVAAALEAAHPGATASLDRATLTVERTGAPCAGYWGATPAPLVSLELGFAPKIAFTRIVASVEQVFTINPDGTGLTQLTYGATNAQQPAWSPDRKRIAFMRNYNVAVMNADGSGEVVLTSDGRSSSPAWSPDGLRLAYGGLDGLAVMDVDGAHQGYLTSGVDESDDGYPDWSPDGSTILFIGYRPPAPTNIFAISSAGGAPTALVADNRIRAGCPSWSPDGTRFAYTLFSLASSDGIWLLDVASGGQGHLALPTTFNYQSPRWSPDGSRLVLAAYDHGLSAWTLETMDPDGGNMMVLTEDGASPSWK